MFFTMYENGIGTHETHVFFGPAINCFIFDGRKQYTNDTTDDM